MLMSRSLLAGGRAPCAFLCSSLPSSSLHAHHEIGPPFLSCRNLARFNSLSLSEPRSPELARVPIRGGRFCLVGRSGNPLNFAGENLGRALRPRFLILRGFPAFLDNKLEEGSGFVWTELKEHAKMVTRKVGKYQVGRTVGEGTFAKVKFAQNTENGEPVAMKILAKSTILKHRMVDQIKREISIMKIVRHPYIVRLHEVLASPSKIYIILEFVSGGELYDKIVHQGRLPENESRRFFQQLIDAVAHCHRKGVYHRDLKPENLLLDSHGNLKVSDFGLSALPLQGDGLLHTTCGTPNYVAPEVLGQRGYDGSAADIWSCGVILYVLMAGYLPFDETDLPTLYKKITAAEFVCPIWFSLGATSLIKRILDPNPRTRIGIEGIRKHSWFRKNYLPVRHKEDEEVNLDDVRAVFDDIKEQYVDEQSESKDGGPLIMNAFEMIALSQGLNLSSLFDRQQDYIKRQTRFVSRKPPKVIISSIEAVAESMALKVHTRNFKTRVEGLSANKAGQFAAVIEVYEVAPSLFMVDVRKAAGDTLEYHKFYKSFCAKLQHIIWKPTEGNTKPGLLRTTSCRS
ncbi:CBL-interacting serine/threonine-protein kinase 24-like isoform X2 [Syzygium oleosum]|uniref:CBL-interacting serine/threonine-protein kinase 24-like isoform X2 n=1 Tax=Syzygium oleosum TaxID=219896 RepID=UPI0024B8C20C|nr:CBL-interacting serine/threonine-protein kinase 24-like isoform X2 [Syzygium oleosum]